MFACEKDYSLMIQIVRRQLVITSDYTALNFETSRGPFSPTRRHQWALLRTIKSTSASSAGSTSRRIAGPGTAIDCRLSVALSAQASTQQERAVTTVVL